MRAYGLTDKGLIRDVNEDCIGITSLSSGLCIAVVCDGMGGAAGGKIASELAESAFMQYMIAAAPELEASKFDTRKIKGALRRAVECANAAVIARAREDASLFGMGCTLNAALYCESRSRIYYANVGDSRLYMITKRSIKQLTKDHSYVQLLVDNKEITPEEAENHPKKNLITRAVGISDDVEADIFDRRISPLSKAYFLLCSDGLHGMLSADTLKSVALSDMSVEEKIFTYIRLANEAGGVDNISAILIYTGGDEAQ